MKIVSLILMTMVSLSLVAGDDEHDKAVREGKKAGISKPYVKPEDAAKCKDGVCFRVVRIEPIERKEEKKK